MENMTRAQLNNLLLFGRDAVVSDEKNCLLLMVGDQEYLRISFVPDNGFLQQVFVTALGTIQNPTNDQILIALEQFCRAMRETECTS